MENESIKGMPKQKLEVSDILKEAVMIYFRNFTFIIFTLFTSLPLFCFMVYFEICLQQILLETSSYYGSMFDFIMEKFDVDYFLKLVQLGFIYMVPLYVLELGSAIVTIELATKVRYEEKKMTLKEMFQKPFGISNLRGTFITSIYVLFLTTCHQLGLLWIVVNYLVYLKNTICYMLFAVICSVVFAKILRLYLEWSAMWNMSLVMSILEGIHGIDALVLSGYFSRGCHRRGLFLMLIFFAWGHFLRLSCIHVGGYEEGYGIIIQVGLFFLVNPLKWVVCMIYFHDCKERNLKKTDEESGKDVKVEHE